MTSRERNREQNFKNILGAGDGIQEKARLDEALGRDLFDQFSYRSDLPGCHRYFVEPYRSVIGPMVERGEFISLPPAIANHYSRIECASFMGLIPEINRAWITVDNTLYLWNYFKPEEFDVYDGLTEAIISVALSVPKAGIFQESVKYVLALATPVEVVLLALCNVNKDGQLKLVPTAYSLPSDNVTMLKIVGSLSGRIFMAGNDGNIYELDYSYTDNSWAALVGGVPQHKCRKINHFAWQWRLVNLMPPFLRSLVEMEDTLAEVIVDNLRNVMYAITSHGVLSAFYLGVNGDETQYFGKGFHVLEAARSYLSGRGYAESSPKVDTFKDLNAPGFQVVGLFPVPVTESKRVHLVVVLANGLRIYLSLLAGHMQYNRIAVSPADAVPSGLEVVHVRSPPGLSTIASCSAAPSREDGDVDAGALPSLLPSTVLHSSCAYYSHGLFMLVVEKAHAPDELVMVFEDHGQRSNASGALPTNTSLPCLREGVSVGLDARNNTGKIYAIKESTAPFLNETYATLRSLHTHSATPPNNSMVRDTSQFVPSSCSSGAGGGVLGKLTGWFDSSPGGAASAEKAVPCSYTNDLRTTSAGYDVGNLDKLIITNELFDEHLPASTCFTQRQVLVLTNQGIHVFKKIRPTDVLYRQLTSSRSDDAIKRVYGFFGLQQACVMSLALCLGLPRDAGGAPLIDNAFALMSSVLPIDNVQLRAMSSMLSLSSPAAYRALAPPTGAVALHDSRLVVSGSNYEFFKSTAHDSLYAVIARVLRPIWFRPVVSKSNLSIPFWWKGDVINELRRPLVIMTDLMRSYFSAAIMGNYSKPEHSAFGNNLMTQQIAARAAQQQATEKMLQLQAKTLEDASLQAFYLLVARSLHALSFIDILRTLLERKAVQVSLVDLAEITFRSLVVLPKVHSSVKKILHEVIQGLAKGDPLVADEVISCLNRDCYHFFSAGDRYSYEAFRLVDAVTRRQALNETNLQGMKEVDSMSSKCVDNFIRASSSWQSVEDVVGERSDLLQACTAMQSLGPLGYNGIVDIALKVADAFKSISAESTLPGSPMRGQQGSAPWDASFFHGGSVLTKEDANLAVQAAYKCLVQQISYVGVKAGHAAQLAMVQRAVANSDDVVFHEMLYGRLVDEAQQVLLDVSSPYVEQYLRGNHPLVLFQYYDHIGAHGKASALMSALATDEQDVPIADRLHYLRSALSSAEQASPTSAAERLLMHQSATELRDALDVADYQLMANERLVADFNSYGYEGAGRAKYSDAQRRHLDVMAEHVHKLGYRLLDVNTLFHEMCLRYRQWDICIMLIHVCGIQDADLLARLWRSFIYRLVPELARSENNQDFLQRKRDPARLETDKRGGVAASFEDVEHWLPSLRAEVQRVVRHLMAIVSPVPIPLGVLIEELQDLLARCQPMDRNYTAQLLIDANVSQHVVLDAYLDLIDRSVELTADQQLHLLASFSAVLTDWMNTADRLDKQHDASAASYLEMIRAGTVRGWLEKARRHLTSLQGRKLHGAQLIKLLDTVTNELHSTNKLMLDLMVV